MYKYVLTFTTGAAAGFAVAYIFVKKQYEERISKHEEEIQSVKEYAKKLVEAYKNEAMKAEKKFEMSISKSEENIVKEYTDYSALTREYDASVKEDTDEEDLEENEDYLEGLALSEITNSKKGPFIISADEYDELPSVEGQVLYYYANDGALVNEDEEMVEDPERFVGDLLISSGFTDDTSPVIYIRNLLLGSDYEITKVFSSFDGL